MAEKQGSDVRNFVDTLQVRSLFARLTLYFPQGVSNLSLNTSSSLQDSAKSIRSRNTGTQETKRRLLRLGL